MSLHCHNESKKNNLHCLPQLSDYSWVLYSHWTLMTHLPVVPKVSTIKLVYKNQFFSWLTLNIPCLCTLYSFCIYKEKRLKE